MEIKYVPQVCTDHEVELKDGQKEMVKATFEGYIMLKGTTYDERMEMLESLSVTANAKGEVDTSTSINMVAETRKLVKRAKEKVISVHLKNLATGVEYKTFEDMDSDPDCDAILSELGFAFRKGFKPGKN